MASTQVDDTPIEDVISESEFEATSKEPEVVALPVESVDKTAAGEEFGEEPPIKEKSDSYSDIEDDEEKDDTNNNNDQSSYLEKSSEAASGFGHEFNDDDDQEEDEDDEA